jgi:hypothetical protein
MSVSQHVSDPWSKPGTSASRSTDYPRSGPTLSLFYADKATYGWPNFEATRGLPNGSNLFVHYHNQQPHAPSYAGSRGFSRAPSYPTQSASPKPVSHVEDGSPRLRTLEQRSYRSSLPGPSQSTRHVQTSYEEQSHSGSPPPLSFYPEQRSSLRSTNVESYPPPRQRQSSFEEYDQDRSASYVDQRSSLRSTSAMRNSQPGYGHNRPPSPYAQQHHVSSSPDFEPPHRSSHYTAYRQHQHTSSSDSPGSPGPSYSHQYDIPPRNPRDTEPPQGDDWHQEHPQSTSPWYYGQSSHSRQNSRQSGSPPENTPREPEWETYTQKVRDLDGTALFCCIWEVDSGKPCNYVAKKQLVKRHILATHLGHK